MKNIIFILLFLLSLILVSCGTATVHQNQDDVPADAIPTEYAGLTNPLGANASADGAKVFATNCTPCHGEAGRGDGPAASALIPHPANLAALGQTASDAYLNWRINTGRPGTAMVAWKGVLSQTQIWQVISFIRTLNNN
ncbi:MAG TPA: cytochrome c [Anaerolineales bacterium]|nr:cytochrome c [Anaerolineales bacterium]